MSGIVTLIVAGGDNVNVIPRDEVRRIIVDDDDSERVAIKIDTVNRQFVIVIAIASKNAMSISNERKTAALAYARSMLADLRLGNPDTDVTWTRTSAPDSGPEWTREEKR